MQTGDTETVLTPDNRSIEVETRAFANGTMKDVHRVVNSDQVLAVFREPLDQVGLDRLSALIDVHRERVLNGPGGEALAPLYRWPTAALQWRGKTALLVPAFEERFLFSYGSRDSDRFKIFGREKQGKWFASARHRYAFLDPREQGQWSDYLGVCTTLSRAVRRLHASGLAHSDLSYRNVLVDPASHGACVIDVDGLVVPGVYPPDVAGTPEFIAPEVVQTRELDIGHPDRILPSINTDRHALSVLIYLYLLGRHPLEGKKVHDTADAERDDALAMGANALWIEDPHDNSNRVGKDSLNEDALPWADPDLVPYTMCGPHIAELFERAFGEGLQNPGARPTAEEWERALTFTHDLLLTCRNSECTAGGYPFDDSRRPNCPLCGNYALGPLSVMNLYSSRTGGSFRPENRRLLVKDGFILQPWHQNRFIFPNERLSDENRQPVARVERRDRELFLVNLTAPDMTDVTSKQPVAIGDAVELADDARILLSKEDGGRLVHVQKIV